MRKPGREFYKWATELVRLKRKRNLTPDIVKRLLNTDLSRWHRILIREEILTPDDDDPVPQYLLQHHREIDWSPLTAVLRGEAIPGRKGAVSNRRLRDARSRVQRSLPGGLLGLAVARAMACAFASVGRSASRQERQHATRQPVSI